MSSGLNHGTSQAIVLVKIVLGKREVVPVEQVLQGAAIAAEISGVNQNCLLYTSDAADDC